MIDTSAVAAALLDFASPVTWRRGTISVPVMMAGRGLRATELVGSAQMQDRLYTARYADLAASPLYPVQRNDRIITSTGTYAVLEAREAPLGNPALVKLTVRGT